MTIDKRCLISYNITSYKLSTYRKSSCMSVSKHLLNDYSERQNKFSPKKPCGIMHIFNNMNLTTKSQ